MENVNPYESGEAELNVSDQQFYQPKVFSLKGRIGRARYIAYGLAQLLAATLLSLVVMFFVGLFFSDAETLEIISTGIMSIIMFGCMVVVSKRRVNDLGLSSWLSVIALIPLVNVLFGFWLTFASGDRNENKYGLPSVANTTGVYVGVALYVIVVLGIILAVALPAYQAYIAAAGG